METTTKRKRTLSLNDNVNPEIKKSKLKSTSQIDNCDDPNDLTCPHCSLVSKIY